VSGTALDIVAVEPWFAGSHRDFLEGLAARSAHRVRPYTLAGRFWKWRQTGSGLVLGRRVADEAPPCDVIFASDFLNLPDFLAATRDTWERRVPAVLYFHENQLAYPLRAGHDLDRAYALANVSGAAAADAVWFNSAHHRRVFLADLEALLAASPDHAPKGLADAIAARSAVVPLGVDLAGLAPHYDPAPRSGPLTVLWNHRWEHDKNPEGFFGACEALAAARADFRLIVLGQRFGRVPPVFEAARERLADHVLHWGYVEKRADYARLLSRADVVVSLAHQDFFGVAVVEAMHAGCMPLLAKRLNYPDLVPESAHPACLVADEADLAARLKVLAADPAPARSGEARKWAERHDWRHAVGRFDTKFREAASLRATGPDLRRDM
jgi:glycosyltransferase involved in cell wall biosynthesis